MLKSLLAAWLVMLTCSGLRAEDKPVPPPRVLTMEPVALIQGYNGILKLRGMQLKSTQQVQFAEAPNIKVEIKDKKDAGDVQGFDKADIGDSEVHIQLTIPPDQPAATLTFTIQTEAGSTAPMKIEILATSQSVEEKEPNNGFREAQAIEMGKPVRGNISQDKDVDVYQFSGRTGEKIRAEIVAARAGSLMDGMLMLYNARGILLAQEDDSAASRDPEVNFTLPADGTYFLVVNDAHDRGGEWRSYELTLKPTP